MIHPLDAITLAQTKLRTRKVRTAVTVMISGLLFGILLGGVFIVAGILQSVETFGKTGIGDRYIIQARPINTNQQYYRESPLTQPEVVERVKQLHKERVEAKETAAENLGIEYRPKIEDPLPISKIEAGESQREIVDIAMRNNPAVQQALIEYNNTAKDTFDIREVTKGYDVKSYPEMRIVEPIDGSLETMKDGKEAALSTEEESTPQTNKRNFAFEQRKGTLLRILDSSITKPFTTSKFDPQSGAIPILIPYSQAEQKLNLDPLDKTATKQEQLDRIKEVHDRASEITIDSCYRNSASRQLLDEAIQAKKLSEQAADKNTPQQVPDIIYAVPSPESCGAVTIVQDSRSEAEKELAAKRNQFDRTFNGEVEPVQHKLQFQVIGVTPLSDTLQQEYSIASTIAAMFSPSIGEYWSIPSGLFKKLPDEQKPDAIFGNHPEKQTILFSQYPAQLVEFSTLDSAKNFLENFRCSFTCNAGFVPSPFGSSSLMIAEAKHHIQQFLYWVVLTVSVIATIILAGMIGRTVADGRRETAVFRAIGARRSDITAIYTTYTLLLALRIVIFATLLGAVLAFATDSWLSADATATARITFGTVDSDKVFRFIGWQSIYTLIVPASIVLASLIAMILPLFRNVRRNPIKDMRDE